MHIGIGVGILGGGASAPVLPVISGMFLDANPAVGAYITAGTPATADGDAVGLLVDQSGAGRDLSEATNKPLLRLNQLNSKPALSFDATNDLLTGTMPTGAGKTIFLVFKRNSVSLNQSTMLGLGANNILLSGNTYRIGFGMYGGAGATSFGGAMQEWNVITLKYINVNSFRMYINGVICSNTTYDPHADYSTGTKIVLGPDPAWAAGGADGLFARVLAYNSALSDTDRAAVESYLLSYYGLSASTQRIEYDSVATVTSTLDAVTLTGYAAYPHNQTGLPILMCFPGWDGDKTIWSLASQKTYAERGIFAVFMSTRGRAGSSGSIDAGGLEPHDIYDVVNAIKTRYTGIVDPDHVYVYGFSGGGMLVHSALTKFPDTYNGGISLYGISDVGRDATYGWWAQNASYRTSIQTRVGGTPAVVPNNYYARDSRAAYANFSGGHLWMFHDTEDGTVQSNHSTRVADVLDAAGLSNYTSIISTVGDPVRYTHDGANGTAADNIALPSVVAKTYPVWTIPASGTVKVIGEIVTKRFEIHLRANGSTTYRLDAAADVVYNTATDTYTVTPLTGAIDVVITQGVKTGSATNISTETEIVVA